MTTVGPIFPLRKLSVGKSLRVNRYVRTWFAACGVVLALAVAPVAADELIKTWKPSVSGEPPSDLFESESVPPVGHPLRKPYEIVLARLQHIRQNINDYTCLLVKRERIGEQVQDYQYIFAKVRLEQRREGEVVRPFSVFLHYAGPERLEGRKVLFVEGAFEGKMLVRNGGDRFSFVTVKVSPDSDLARKESLSPITDVGFEKMAVALAQKIRQDVEADPTGENTQVEYFRSARIDGRECSRIQVTHPQKQNDLEFHIANVFLDEQWKIPLRVEVYGWPENEDEQPPLIGEYTYTRLKLNVGLTDDDFRESVIRGRSR